MRILSISTVFPRPDEPRLGLFIAQRLKHLAELTEVVVAAPVPWLDSAGPSIRIPRLNGCSERQDGRLRVIHPRWLYPPAYGDFNGRWLAWCLAGVLDELRKDYPFDVIDAHFGHPEGIAAAFLAKRYGCPYTVTLRGNETMHGASERKRRRMSAAIQGAAAVIAVSRRLAEYAQQLGVARDRIHVIPNGIDGEVFHPRKREDARQALGMRDDSRHIVSAGYLIERKGHHRIVETLPALHAAGIRCDLWIVGEGGREGNFEPQIRESVEAAGMGGRVHMVGGVQPEILAAYLSAADLFCLASTREGWPNVVNEALACGTPVVASDVGGVPEMLPGNEFGIVVRPGDFAALREGLKEGLRRRWDREAIASWGGRRTWNAVADDVMRVFRSIGIFSSKDEPEE